MPRKSSWSDEDREKLIDLVSKNPILWQNDLRDHMRTDKADDVYAGSENPFQGAAMCDVIFASKNLFRFRWRLLRQHFRVFAAAKRKSELKHEQCFS